MRTFDHRPNYFYLWIVNLLRLSLYFCFWTVQRVLDMILFDIPPLLYSICNDEEYFPFAYELFTAFGITNLDRHIYIVSIRIATNSLDYLIWVIEILCRKYFFVNEFYWKKIMFCFEDEEIMSNWYCHLYSLWAMSIVHSIRLNLHLNKQSKTNEQIYLILIIYIKKNVRLMPSVR